MPQLVHLHRKYASNGLVIIAVHDASVSKQTLLSSEQELLDLSTIPFRMAVDSAPDKPKVTELTGKGKTIEAYGVTSFPTLILIDKDGQVVTTNPAEEDIVALGVGPVLGKSTFFGFRVSNEVRTLLIRIGATIALVLLLALVFVVLKTRHSRYP